MRNPQTRQAQRTKAKGGPRGLKASAGSTRGRKTTRVAAAAGYSRAGARALTPTARSELAGLLEARALAPGQPLKGTTVPAASLKRGSSGAAVKQLQSALVKLGHMTQAQMNTGPGNFGAQTEASLKAFQKAHGVNAIGVYGPKTRAAFARLGATVGGGGVEPPSTHKNPFLSQFQRALTRLGLPKGWATSEALWQLIQHESTWNPRAKNPRSTAFGLFQFLRATWASYCKEAPYGSTDPYVQALGGFRYIKDRYKTPQGAWAFWQRNRSY